MDFDFTSDQEQLRDVVRRWVDKDYDIEHRRALVKAGGHAGADASGAWQSLAELGLLGLAVTGEHGGMDMGPFAVVDELDDIDLGAMLQGRQFLGLGRRLGSQMGVIGPDRHCHVGRRLGMAGAGGEGWDDERARAGAPG